ncbi:GDSL esterase/lipase At1g54790-like [Durio zibethinus]|uniref:GDSL esterase/lipase At1g54790-like n=1 Tax=Durio zibethinus TaxID=66656 RepID=A0A6P5XIM7_DURZI|nr:GDSL esterase/lipase At1g54790-like [Durio zibethinus]
MALNMYSLLKLVLICSFLPTNSPSSLNYPAVFNFGDSNSDTGGIVAGKAFPLIPPNGETYFLEPSGRFCDGRLIIDFLMEAMELPYLNPYLDSVGSPSFATGCNFATGGSTILPANAVSTSPFSFNLQLSQFFRFKNRVIALLLEDKELQRYLPPEDSFKQGLYMFDIGQNDLDAAFYSSTSEEQVLASIPKILSGLKYGIKRLYDAGARNFWIHNTGPLGCLPRIIATFGKNASNLDELGCIISHNRAANVFNLKLYDICLKFLAQLPEANCTFVDIYSIKLNLISNYSLYGFQQPLAACCGYGGPPLNFDTRITCGVTKNLNGSIVTANSCNNTAKNINWDGNHYTEAANRFVADLILSGNYSDSPHLANAPLILT